MTLDKRAETHWQTLSDAEKYRWLARARGDEPAPWMLADRMIARAKTLAYTDRPQETGLEENR